MRYSYCLINKTVLAYGRTENRLAGRVGGVKVILVAAEAEGHAGYYM